MILAAGLSPAWQQIVVLEHLQPGEVNRAREVQWCASGKVVNVGLALDHLGAESRTLSLVGGWSGDAIEQEFSSLNVPHRWVRTHAATRICTTLLDRSTGRTTEVVENAGPVSDEELARFIAAYDEEAAQANMVILTGSLPAGAPGTLYRELVERTPGQVLLDMRGLELLAVLDCQPLLVKPNREELGRTFDRPLDTDAEMLSAMRELNRRGAQWVVVTQGAQAVWATSASATYRAQPPRVDTINPIGCGDCLAAGIAWAISEGRPIPKALGYGIAAAAENATQLLPSRLDPARVRALAESILIEALQGG